ncbi:MAG: DUF4159 domain-containing protein, partial [Rhizobiaceae bacterium]
MNILGLTFTSPLLLFGLLALPLIWWLLRLTPPKPRHEIFPPTRILEGIAKKEETPAKSPWWLTLLRLLMAAAVILALCEPVWKAQGNKLSGKGPLMIIMDDTWSAGQNWNIRKSNAEKLLIEAEKAGRPVALVLASEGASADLSSDLAPMMRKRLSAAEPKPIQDSYAGLAKKIQNLRSGSFETLVWLSSGLKTKGSTAIQDALNSSNIKQLLYFAPKDQQTVVLSKVANTPEALSVDVERIGKQGSQSGKITAYDQQGRSISTTEFTILAGKQTITAQFKLPIELRNDVTRITIDNSTTAGGVQLLDERFRRRRVGLISGGKADQVQPLLSPLYFISRALNPFSEVREARVSNVSEAVPQLIEENISTLVLADIGTLPRQTSITLEKWINKGGMLVRFSGPRLAAASDDKLVPVLLRRGGRSLGGTLTWGEPQPLASFEESSPFNGIVIPDDVTISRQVLAEPSIDLAQKTWASLADGTPLVTAAKRGKGWIVLFHVTADSSWSNLPLSGAFVDMLRRIVAVSNGTIAADQTRSENATKAGQTKDLALPPLQMIDGYGRLVQPNTSTRPLTISQSTPPKVSLQNPPGTYGTNDAFVALNLFNGFANLQTLKPSLFNKNIKQHAYQSVEASPFKPWLLALALLLLTLDCLAVLWMAGALRIAPKNALASIALAFFLSVGTTDSWAQDTEIDYINTLRTRIAYVITGDQGLDEMSRKGLIGLTQFISSRTSLEPGNPVGVNISKDELAFYPLLYWPISVAVSVPDAKAMARVDAFMKKGGSVLFDTRDQLTGGYSGNAISIETQR